MELALTIDDLPMGGTNNILQTDTQVAASIIATLSKHKIPEVYGFVIGNKTANMSERQNILNSWRAAGFLLGNHTYSHLDLANVKANEFISDLEKTESVLIDHAKTIEELKVFRYPYLSEGDSNEKRYAVRSVLSKRKYVIAHVTIDFRDWEFAVPYMRCMEKNDLNAIKNLKKKYLDLAQENIHFSEKASEIIWGKRKIPHILLLHMSAHTAAFLPDLINMMIASKVTFISAKQAILDKFYEEDTTYVGRNGKTFIWQAIETRKIKLKDISLPLAPTAWLQNWCK